MPRPTIIRRLFLPLLTLGFLLSLSGCQPQQQASPWPSDLKVGQKVSIGTAGEVGAGRAEVLKIEGNWLTVRDRMGTKLIPREAVTLIVVLGDS